ncbi:MAG: DUF3500 domain-containing protein [Verrucomicrobiota bacterium]
MTGFVCSLLLFSFPRGVALTTDKLNASMDHFLESLHETQQKQAVFEFKSKERLNWHYFPRDRAGVPLSSLSVSQKETFRELLSLLLSVKGQRVVDQVIAMENILYQKALQDGDDAERRDPGKYYISLFRESNNKDIIGVRFEGHHLSINLSLVQGGISTTPLFLGTDPAKVSGGELDGLEALRPIVNRAQNILETLTEDQLRQTIVGRAPREILTRAQQTIQRPKPRGINIMTCSSKTQSAFWELITWYAEVYHPTISNTKITEMKASSDDTLFFSWSGDPDAKAPHYFSCQGDDWLIEYVNSQASANHVHTVWRDTSNDFGRDLLSEQISTSH